MSEPSLPTVRADADIRTGRAWDIVLALMLVGVGLSGFLFSPSMPDSPGSIVTALVLSIIYAMAIGAGLFAPFRMKRRGAVVGLAIVGVLWIWALLRILISD